MPDASSVSQPGKSLPLRILLVDDNEMNQELALAVLEQLGYCADVAGNGHEAVQALRQKAYDVVLMDVEMPGMDGLEATRVIRREVETASQPSIIAMTAADLSDDRERCLAAGMNGYIGKPIPVRELAETLSRCRPLSEGGQAGLLEKAAKKQAPEKVAGAGTVQVLDPAAIERLKATLGGQAKAMLPALIDGFIEEAPRLFERARQALEKKDESELRRTAHTLKSNAANFGLMALVEAARELESAAKSRALEGAERLLGRVEAEWSRAREALQEFRKGM